MIGGDANGSVALLYDVASGRVFQRLAGARSPIAFSRDGSMVATGFDVTRGAIWDVRTGAKIGSLTAHSSPLASLGFSPDGARLVSMSTDQIVRVFDAKSGRQTITLPTSDLAAEAQDVVVRGLPTSFSRSQVRFSLDGLKIVRTRTESVANGLAVHIQKWNGSPGR